MPLFREKKHWLILLVGMVLSSILFAACGENSPSILDTHGPVAQQESFIFWLILVVATIVFLGVEGTLIYFIVRYRERPGMPTPKQIHGNLRVEVLWTVIPALILFIVLAFTIQGLFAVAAEPNEGRTIEVRAVGHQWWWEFYYPQYKITTADSLEIPENTVIHVNLYSNNVIHSFWVPALTGKTDLIPGHDNQKWFKADKQGQYVGICAEFCGTQHANMRFNVIVRSNNDFMSWVRTQQQAAAAPAGDQATAGRQLFEQQCATCHGIVGVKGVTGYDDPAVACNDPKKACLIGPNLTHFGSRNLIAGGVLDNNAEACTPGPNLVQRCNLAKWLKDPQGVKPGNDMQIGQLTDEQVGQLVAYLLSLK